MGGCLWTRWLNGRDLGQQEPSRPHVATHGHFARTLQDAAHESGQPGLPPAAGRGYERRCLSGLELDDAAARIPHSEDEIGVI